MDVEVDAGRVGGHDVACFPPGGGARSPPPRWIWLRREHRVLSPTLGAAPWALRQGPEDPVVNPGPYSGAEDAGGVEGAVDVVVVIKNA